MSIIFQQKVMKNSFLQHGSKVFLWNAPYVIEFQLIFDFSFCDMLCGSDFLSPFSNAFKISKSVRKKIDSTYY